MSLTAKIKSGSFQVREPCSVEIIIQTTDHLHVGDSIKIQFPNTWTVIYTPSFTRNLQSDNPAQEHYIIVETDEKNTDFKIEIKPRHLNNPAGIFRHGKLITATLTQGSIPPDSPIHVLYLNTFAPYVAESEKVWIRINGKAPVTDPILTVKPGLAEKIRILAPSGVEPEEKFDILIVSLDKYGNCSSSKYKNQILYLNDETIVTDNLNFESSIRIPVTLNKEGIYRFKMNNIVSNAVRVKKNFHGPFWGDIHFHTKLSHDGQGTDPYKYSQNVSNLDFACVTDHWSSLGNEGYAKIREWARDADKPGKFATILADERNPKLMQGDHNIYFRDEEYFLKYSEKPENISLADPQSTVQTLKELDHNRVMLIPHHTGLAWRNLPEDGIGRAINLDACEDHDLRPVMEIYSHHGQSELYAPQHILSYEFNRMRNPERRSNVSVPGGPYYAQNYWMAGRKIGVIGSSDEHSGQSGRPHGGLTAVWTKTLTREKIFDAIRNRQCYATTGERILIDFSIDSIMMGDTGQKKKGQKLTIKLQVWGTDLLLRVEILRFRHGIDSTFNTILSEPPRPETTDIAYEIKDTVTSFCLYYARVTQEPLDWPNMAWTSPIWIEVKDKT
jgi:hypothetical protein